MKERYVIKYYNIGYREYFWCRKYKTWFLTISKNSGFMSEADARSTLINFNSGTYEIIKIYIK